jgi:bacterioferritin (cytochrome b1)
LDRERVIAVLNDVLASENDSTTRRLIEEILKTEEEHADDLANMLTRVAS